MAAHFSAAPRFVLRPIKQGGGDAESVLVAQTIFGLWNEERLFQRMFVLPMFRLEAVSDDIKRLATGGLCSSGSSLRLTQ
jgi:hypothetical protein